MKWRTHRCKLRRHQLDDQIICGGPFNTSPRWEIPICHPPVTHMVNWSCFPPPKRESCVLGGFQQHSAVQKYPSQTAGQNRGPPEFETHNNWGHPDCRTHTSAVMTRAFQVATSLLRQISRGASVFEIPTATNYMGRRGLRGRLNLCWIWWLLSGDGDDEDYRMARWVRIKMIIRQSSEYSQCDYCEEGAG